MAKTEYESNRLESFIYCICVPMRHLTRAHPECKELRDYFKGLILELNMLEWGGPTKEHRIFKIKSEIP